LWKQLFELLGVKLWIFVLSICTGSSFNKVIKGWVGIACEKFFCVANGAKLLCVVNVGSWRLSCWCSKNMLSYYTTCAFNSKRNLTPIWLIDIKIDIDLMESI
jgi:hypothetical protein